jgi:hypothetical protein
MSIRRGKPFTATFAVQDPAASRPLPKTGVTFSTGQVQISKDGGSFANTTNLPSEIGSSGRYALTLTDAETSADSVYVTIAASGYDPIDLPLATNGAPVGTVITGGGGNSATSFATSLAAGTADFYKNALIVFLTGALADSAPQKCSAYAVTNGVITVSSAFVATPSVGDRFAVVTF